MSKISDELSDGLCRVATGGGIAKRTLYTDADVTVVNVKRPVIINAIVDVVQRSDLADRLMLLELERVTERRTERQVEERFRKYQAKALGALLKSVQAALRTWRSTSLPKLPRMADACAWAEAGVQGLGVQPLDFFKAFTSASEDAQTRIIESDLLGSLIVTLAQRDGFDGTASKLLERLNMMTEKQAGLPKNAPALGQELRRLDPALRRGYGICIDFMRTADQRTIQIKKQPSSPSSPSLNHVSLAESDDDDSNDRNRMINTTEGEAPF